MTPLAEHKITVMYRSFVKQYIIDFLEAPIQQWTEKQLERLAIQNQVLLQCSAPVFVYNGVRYTAGNVEREQGENRQLHHSLQGAVLELIQPPAFNDKKRKAALSNYLTKVFQYVNTVVDLFAVLPSQLHIGIGTVDRTIFDTACTVNPKSELMAFKEANKKGASILKEYMAINLIYQQD